MSTNRQDAELLPSPALLAGYCGWRVHPGDTACVPYTWEQFLAYYGSKFELVRIKCCHVFFCFQAYQH